MGWLGNIYASIAPESAYKRQMYKNALNELKSYDAGGYGRSNANWRASNNPAEIEDRGERDTVRARARDLERNSDIMNATVGAFKRNVIGGGYTLQIRTEDAELNAKLENAWKKWTKARNCDVTATQSFNQILRMAVERKKIDGGILFVKRYTNEGFVPFQLQMLEVDELDTTVIKPKKSGNRVYGGIEFNSFNKPQGYHIRQYDLDGLYARESVYIEAKDVIFYYTKKRPSQIREMSDMAQTIPRIRDTNEFITAVSVKERIQACLSIFIKKAFPTSGTSIGRGTAGATERISYEGKTISPGMIKELNVGDEIQVVNPSGQSADATGFTKLQERLVGAGQGLSYEAISRDMSESNYSSARQGLIEDELTYREEVERLKEILDEIYETFVISLVLNKTVEIKDFWSNKDKYLKHEWVKEPKAWIDPKKEAEATATALKTGQKTFKQIAAENGRDWKDQIDDIAECLEYAKEKGVNLGGALFGYEETTQETVAETES